ncbi:c-type cytochrome [Desulfonatronum sp. SC1]|uniref:c-type cytochrome n=1 Tax=Desulfonatronum sp. SC1 TaxID=2109626 RepID=UPI000D31DC46|nr:c-type cytochrome [Desulfonatronum sp. SC1]PTN32359.1 hypothetical protein C6366_16510 [Desulfonatronum sp. SC1]
MKKTTLITSLALGGILLFAGTAAVSYEALDGEKLYQERCSQCHGLGRVDRATKDLAAWETTVDRMIGKRAGLLNAEERDAVVEYLANR